MKKLLLSIGLLSGVMLSSTTANAACVAADCAALGYSTATVEGCTRYIVCPFDTSYKACASTSSETTGTMTCEEAVAAAGGKYLGSRAEGNLSVYDDKDVVYYAHDYNLGRVLIEGDGSVTFKDAREIAECQDSGYGTFYAQLVYLGDNGFNHLRIDNSNRVAINVLQIAKGGHPIIALNAPVVDIGFLDHTSTSHAPNPTLFFAGSPEGTGLPTVNMNTWCVEGDNSDGCYINVVTRSWTSGNFVNWYDCQPAEDINVKPIKTHLVPYIGGGQYSFGDSTSYGFVGGIYTTGCGTFETDCLGDASICFRPS